VPVKPVLVECVPNFSEGRRAEVIQAIVAAISDQSVHLLDISSDPDHNRTVVTFAGTPEAVSEAAFRGIETAARLIDLSLHDGVHPRIGAADVVPLVPLRDISLTECAALAYKLGERVAETLNLPVYLYEAAAQRPERRNLAVVRKDPYEKLIQTIGSDPDRAPDFGPSLLGSAGAVAIGARNPLIAFNAYLDTDDVEIARSIARAVRESGGGVPYLKAIGVLVNGQAQVSMNVIDFRQTSLYLIMERLREVVHQHQVSITRTELVGLIPQTALFDTALAYLQLPPALASPTIGQILEYRVGETTGDYRVLPFE
jgi:glutamate formiminotransferase